MMPLIVRCKECGYPLYSGGFQFVRYMTKSIPQQIFDIHEGECPNCRKRLEVSNVKKEDVTISPNPEFDFPFQRKKDES